MKKLLATLALLLGALHILSAIPAYPGPIKVTQPDGTVITVRLHGDEWYHYFTDERGRVVARDAAGFFRPAEKPSREALDEAAEMRRSANRIRAQAAAKASSMSLGSHRIPVILVEFQDDRFSIDDPKAAFEAMLNEDGYSANGATGSVHEFYTENSHGLYDPVFEVFGPYLLSKNRASYANNAAGALLEACKGMNAQIDFSRYDSDGDSYVDMTLMYYSGYSQAEGADATHIWPHASSVYSGTQLDGKYLGTYFCTAELKGYSGTKMCGIGPTTHEFAHSLGLPDFYDTDYETNEEAGGLYSFSTMCSGSYNNDGRTPPYFNAEELMMLGWMDGLTEVERQGNLTIPPIRDRVAYKVPSSVAGEYFVLECRAKTRWDAYLPGHGLLVYHVDKSQRQVTIIQNGRERNYTAATLWNNWQASNAINENGTHPCFYLVPAAEQSSMYYYYGESRIPFPGAKKVTKYTPVDWDGVQADFKFTNIAFSSNQSTLTVSYTTTPGVSGRVMNTSAKPVRDASVALYVGNALKKSATTGSDGTFNFEGIDMADVTYTLKVTCLGYVAYEGEVAVGRRVSTVDVYLRKDGESTESEFRKYDPSASTTSFGDGRTDFAAAIQMSAAEAAPLAGKQLKTISFQPAADADPIAAYVFVEAGGRRKFTQKVDNFRPGEMNTVNVVAQEYSIPSGTSLYIGYALVGCSVENPLTVQRCAKERMGYFGTYNGTRAVSWEDMTVDGIYYTPVLSAGLGEPVQPEMGFNHIANPGNGVYAAGSRFDLTLVRYEDDPYTTLSWTFDGLAVQGGSVTLTAGSHTVRAHLTYPDGTAEVITLEIRAE